MAEPPAHSWPGPAAADGPNDPYATRPRWDVGGPQPAFLTLACQGAITGRVLDVGCGTGEHALLAASRGLDATGIDLAESALQAARCKARKRRLTVRFVRWDALRLADLGATFDTVLDCGLFHIFGDHDRATYLASLHAALRPGGQYLMLCCSDRQPSQPGLRPRKVSLGELTACFTDGWSAVSIEPATIDSLLGPASIQAWLVSATRN